jgi:predicted LPLAT superfamily acyltransferase
LIDKTAILSGYGKKFTYEFDGEDYLRQMKNGGILLGAHIGNWEVSGQLLDRLKTKINLLVYDGEHQKIKQYLSSHEVDKSIQFIVIKDDYSHIYSINNALDNRELVAIHGDRYTESSKTDIFNFMGYDAKFPTGPFYLAAKFNVPISFTFAMKAGKYHYHFYASPPFNIKETPRTKGSSDIIKTAMKDYISTLESILRKNPVHWFNYFDFWEGAVKNK